MKYQPLTRIAQAKLRQVLQPGDRAIDATAGNGHDTLFLAEQVGHGGYVYAFDIQTRAIESSLLRLAKSGYSKRVTLCQKNHAKLLHHVPDNWHNRVAAITFNLGYLPHSDKSIITRAEHTLPALDHSLCLLQANGALCLLVYPQHAGGTSEAAAVTRWLQQNAHVLEVEVTESNGPMLYFCRPRA